MILLEDLEPAREVSGGSRKRLFGDAPTHPVQPTEATQPSHQEERDMPKRLSDLDPTKSPKGGKKATRKKATKKKATKKKATKKKATKKKALRKKR